MRSSFRGLQPVCDMYRRCREHVAAASSCQGARPAAASCFQWRNWPQPADSAVLRAMQNDLQAQARAHRLGQLRTVMIYRCAARRRSDTPAQLGGETVWQMVNLTIVPRPAPEVLQDACCPLGALQTAHCGLPL